jgi:hypothetical protein
MQIFSQTATVLSVMPFLANAPQADEEMPHTAEMHVPAEYRLNAFQVKQVSLHPARIRCSDTAGIGL